MTNVARIVGKIVSFLPKTEGAAGRIHLTGKQLELMAKAGGPEGDVLLKILSKNPEISSLDLAYKSKSNYSIGAFKVMEGKTPYMTGAISVTEKGKGIFKPEVKFRYGGKYGNASGFYYRDTGFPTI